MKITLPLFIIVLSSQVLAQGYFPLQTGNLWQYQSTDLQYPDRYETLILGDTVLPNGRTYAQFNHTNFGSRFLRQDGSKVFGYSQIDSTEFVLFDFAANPGDTITRFQGQQYRIVLQGIYPSNYQGRTTWLFLLLAGSGPGSYDFADWWITDSLGLTYLIGEPGMSYYVTGMRIDGTIYGTILSVQSPSTSISATTTLRQNYPNPFNPSTTITYELEKSSFVRVSVYDLLGREVSVLVNEMKNAGVHELKFTGSGLSGGVYLYRVTAGSYVQTRKMVLLK